MDYENVKDIDVIYDFVKHTVVVTRWWNKRGVWLVTITRKGSVTSPWCSMGADERSLKAKKLDRQLKEAEQTLQRLDMEARTAPAPASTALVRKVRDYRKDLQKLSSEVKRMAMSAQASEASR